MTLDRDTLLRILPRVPAHKVDDYIVRNNDAMLAACVDTPARIAMWLAQWGHETGSFRYLEELADGSAYEGRADLGNTQAGDGRRFKGRGVPMLTGRANYAAFSRAMDCDFVAEPELVARPQWAFRAAGWYWTGRDLNPLADARDIRAVTRKINGGFNGLQQRAAIFATALGVLAP
jgi:putative chitinase